MDGSWHNACSYVATNHNVTHDGVFNGCGLEILSPYFLYGLNSDLESLSFCDSTSNGQSDTVQYK
jgi:hypothetical protein